MLMVASAINSLKSIALDSCATVNAVMFHLGPGRERHLWTRGYRLLSAKLSGAVSILLWIGVITSGRLIAYL